MAIPTPAIPSFTDGLVVNAAALNALAANLTNLYNYNQGAFNSQRPVVVANQTVAQSMTNGGTGGLCTFNSASPNVGNMWTASQATQITIQIAGMYLVMGAMSYPNLAGATLSTIGRADLMLNGTTPGTNTVCSTDDPSMVVGNGETPVAFYMANVAAGSTFYLGWTHTHGATTNSRVTFGGSFLAAVYLGSST